jgi:hypothetical protein
MRLASVHGGRGDAAVAFCLLAIGAWSWARSAGAPAGAVEVAPREVALGSMPEGEERVVRLVVANRGVSREALEVVPSCTCMALDRGPLVLEPHATAEVFVRVSTARKAGFNAAHVQIARPSGAVVAQSRITFTAVQPFVFDPPVLFLRAGEESVATRAFCLTGGVPARVSATAGDPALSVTVAPSGKRSFEIRVALAGRPRSRLATLRVTASGSRGDQTVGEVAVSVPSTRIGDFRVAPVAEQLPEGRVRSWILLDAESGCDLAVRSLRGVPAGDLSWTATSGVGTAGSHLWIEVVAPGAAWPRSIEAVVCGGDVEERIVAALPERPRT